MAVARVEATAVAMVAAVMAVAVPAVAMAEMKAAAAAMVDAPTYALAVFALHRAKSPTALPFALLAQQHQLAVRRGD